MVILFSAVWSIQSVLINLDESTESVGVDSPCNCYNAMVKADPATTQWACLAYW